MHVRCTCTIQVLIKDDGRFRFHVNRDFAPILAVQKDHASIVL